MKKIDANKDEFEVDYVNALINDNYIIPGINGIVVDELNSYYVMKEKEVFDTSLFVLKEIKPNNSYYDHIDLIISKGNPNKQSVAIIINNNKDILEYSLKKKIIVNRLVDINSVKEKKDYYQINNDFLHYEEVDKALDKNGENTNICIVNESNLQICKDYGRYLVKPSLVLNNHSKFLNNNIEPGEIILIEDDFILSKFKLLLKKIEYHNLKIVSLSYLISEAR